MPDTDLIAELEPAIDSPDWGIFYLAMHNNRHRILAALRQAKADRDQCGELAKALREAGRLKVAETGDTPDQDKRELCWCHCNSDRCLNEPRCQAAAEALANVVKQGL